jgi:hypothetical protein
VSTTTVLQSVPGSPSTGSEPTVHSGAGATVVVGSAPRRREVVVVTRSAAESGSLARVCVSSQVAHSPSAAAAMTATRATAAAHAFIGDAT